MPEGGGLTVIVTDCIGEVPPGPVDWNWKVVVEVKGLVNTLPEREPPLDHGP